MLRLGIIGCGSIAQKHIGAIADNGGKFRLVAASDVYIEKAARLKAMYEKMAGIRYGSAVYQDYRSMIERERPDMVSILTESGMHYPIALDCIQQGINVLVEKPLSLSLEQVDRLISSARENRVKLGVIHQHRFNPYIKTLKERVDSGSFEELYYGVVSVRWNRDQDYYRRAEWRGTEDMDGGIMMNQCIHGVDLLQWLLDEKAVEAYGYGRNYSHPYIQTEDTAFALVKFGNGVVGVIEGTVSIFPHSPENSICIFGKRGSVKVGGRNLDRMECWAFSGGVSKRPKAFFGDGWRKYRRIGPLHAEVYRDFAEAVENGVNPMVDGKEARKSIEIILAVQQSIKSGLPVTIPLKGEINDEGC